MAGPFERAYTRGVTEKVGPPPSRPRALPPAPFALHGAVITPEGAWSSGYVTVATGLIAAVSKRKPTDVPVVETDGVILPGLIDLHGHPDFNVFAAWEPPKLYANRYRWRASAPYKALVRDPQNTILSTLPPQTQSRYAEVRALRGRHDGDPGFERGEHEQERRTVGAQRGSLDLRRPQGPGDDRPAVGVVTGHAPAGEDRRGHRDR